MILTLARRWAVPGRIALYAVTLAVGPLVLWLMVGIWRTQHVAFGDFHNAFLPAGRAVLHGNSPYPHHFSVNAAMPFVYPAIAAWAYVPLTFFSYSTAAVIYFALMLAALGGGMYILGVRDPRCYSIVLLWPAVLGGIQAGAVGAFFVLGIAIIWRYRDRDKAWIVLALLCAIKPFVFPLALYMVFTRRFRALTITAVSGVIFVLVPWAAIGFQGIVDYPSLLLTLDQKERGLGFGIGNLASSAGIPSALSYLVVAALVWGAWRLRGDHQRLFIICTVLTLAASPILWTHYFMLLVVPVAIVSRRLSLIWFVPILGTIGLDIGQPPDVILLPLTIWWAYTAIVLYMALKPPSTVAHHSAQLQPAEEADTPALATAA